MNIKTKLVTALTLAVLVVPGISMAQTMSVAQLQAEIQSLTAQLTQLEAQFAAAGGTTTTWCYTFNNNLSIGMSSNAVTELQTALQKDGESVTITGTFDDQTASAVTAFQEKYQTAILAPYGLNYGTGYAGKSTRAELNSLFGCTGNNPITPTPPIHICPAWGCNGPEPIVPPVTVPTSTTSGSATISYFYAMPSTVSSGQTTSLTFSASGSTLSKLKVILTCPAGTSASLGECYTPPTFAANANGYGLGVINTTGVSQQMIATLVGYDANGNVLVSQATPITILPAGGVTTPIASSTPTPTITSFTATPDSSFSIPNNYNVGWTVIYNWSNPPLTVSLNFACVQGLTVNSVNDGGQASAFPCGTASSPLAYGQGSQDFSFINNSSNPITETITLSLGSIQTATQTVVIPPMSSQVSSVGGVLTGSLSQSTPASSYLGMGITGVTLAQYQFTADANGSENLTQVNVTDSSSANSVSASTDHATFINYRLIDASGNVLGTASENANGTLQFNLSSFTIPVNSTALVNLVADVNSYPYATSGAAHAFALTSFNYANTVAAATQNVTSNNIGSLFTVYQTTLNATGASFTNPSSVSAVGNTVGAFTFTAGNGNKSPIVKVITLSTNGSVIQASTAQTLGLYDASNPSVLLGSVTMMGTGNAVFNLNSSPWTIPSGSSKTLLVKVLSAPTNLVSMTNGSTGSYQVLLQNVIWTDGVTASIPSLSPSISMPIASQNITGLSTASAPVTYTGTLNVTLDSSTPPPTVVAPGDNSIVFAQVRLSAVGGNVNAQWFSVVSNSANAVSGLSNIRIFNGSTLLGTAQNLQSYASGAPGGYVNVPESIPVTLMSGTSVVLTLVADVAPSASGTLNLGIGGGGGNYAAMTPNYSVYGNTMTASTVGAAG